MTRGFRPVLPVAVLVIVTFTGVLWAQSRGLLDTDPPTLTVRAPAPLVDQRPWTLDIAVHDQRPGMKDLTLHLDDTPRALPPTGGSWTLPADTLAPGPHEITLVARDASWSRNAAVQTLIVVIPAPEPPEPAGPSEPGAPPPHDLER